MEDYLFFVIITLLIIFLFFGCNRKIIIEPKINNLACEYSVDNYVNKLWI